jgi:hypothetical protein
MSWPEPFGSPLHIWVRENTASARYARGNDRRQMVGERAADGVRPRCRNWICACDAVHNIESASSPQMLARKITSVSTHPHHLIWLPPRIGTGLPKLTGNAKWGFAFGPIDFRDRQRWCVP